MKADCTIKKGRHNTQLVFFCEVQLILKHLKALLLNQMKSSLGKGKTNCAVEMSFCVRVLVRSNNWLEVTQGWHNFSVDLDHGFKVHLFILAL